MTGQQSNQQQPAAPYSVDTLDVHDKGLVWAREYNDNAAGPLGDPFSTMATDEVPPPAALDQRLQMYVINNVNSEPLIDYTTERPVGRSVEFAPWESFPPSPVLGAGVRVAVAYFRVLQLSVDFEQANQPRVPLMLAGAGLVGHVPDEPFVLWQIEDNGGDQGGARVEEYSAGGAGGVTSGATGLNIGDSAYYRVIITTDNATITNTETAASSDGLAWSTLDTQSIGSVVRRWGFGCTGFCIGAFDWIRMYSYVVTAVSADSGAPIPAIPATGARLYIP